MAQLELLGQPVSRGAMALHIDARGLEEAIADIDSIAARSTDLSADLEKLGYRIAAAMRRKIMAGLSPPLSPQYAEWKRKKGKGAEPILKFDGKLYESIKPLEVGPLLLRVGPEDWKAVYHVSLEPRSKMPLRDFVSFEEQEWADLIERALTVGILAGAEAALNEKSLAEDMGLSEFPEAA